MTAMVSPRLSSLPELAIDCLAVTNGAATMRTQAGQIRSRTHKVSDVWSGLRTLLEMDDIDGLYTALEAAVTVSEEYEEAVGAAADAVAEFAETVFGLQGERDRLAEEISELRSVEQLSLASTPEDPVGMSPELIENQSAGLRYRISDLGSRFEQAEDDCVAALRRIDTGHGYELRPADPGGLMVAAASGMPVWVSQAPRLELALGRQAMAVLTKLGTLSAKEQRAWLARNPRFLDAVQDAPPDANEVAAWWHGLGEDAATASAGQLGLIAAMPGVLGNLEGVGYWARDRANRAVLATRIRDLDRLGEQLKGTGFSNVPYTIDPAQALLAQHGYTETSYAEAVASSHDIDRSLGLSDDIPPRMLVSLDDSTPSLAAISIGDLDTAGYTTYLVSGMFSSTTDMQGPVDQALELHKSEVVLAANLNIQEGIATVAWIGYDSPDLLTVGSNDHAEAGAVKLTDALTGYGAVNDLKPKPGHLTVGAHSYGTTTGMLALQQALGVDAFAMYGSAGADAVDRVQDLQVPAGQVYVTETDSDKLAPFGRYISRRGDPDSDLFGAHHYGSDGDGIDPETDKRYSPSEGHSEYLTPNSEGLRNLAYISLGRGDQVTGD